MRFAKLIFALWVGLSIGCGSGTPTIDSSPMSTAREMLEKVADTGVVGDQLKEIEAELEKMRFTDGSKATYLIKQLRQLKLMKDAAKIKAVASDMAGQL